jgi:hypothetical protein
VLLVANAFPRQVQPQAFVTPTQTNRITLAATWRVQPVASLLERGWKGNDALALAGSAGPGLCKQPCHGV